MGERLDAAVKAWRRLPAEARAEVRDGLMQQARWALLMSNRATLVHEESEVARWIQIESSRFALLALLDAAEEETP